MPKAAMIAIGIVVPLLVIYFHPFEGNRQRDLPGDLPARFGKQEALSFENRGIAP